MCRMAILQEGVRYESAVWWGRRKGMLPSLSSQWVESACRQGQSPGTYPGLACPAQQPVLSEWPSVIQALHLVHTGEQAVHRGGGAGI